MAADVIGVSLPVRNYRELSHELLGRHTESLASVKLAGSLLSAKVKIPILREFLGPIGTFFLGGLAPLRAFNIRITLPEAAPWPLVDSDFAAQQLVFVHCAS